jgi:UDP-glucuronate decarboxylase
MSKIIVTGGAGFIGSWLCERLLDQKHEVVCLDNMFTSHRENIAHLIDHHNFEFLRHDVCDPWHIECDEIYHLACPASPVHYQRNPVRTIETAMIGTRNALDCAHNTKAKILITSTSEVYGDPEQHPQKEEYWGHVNPLGPRACYDDQTEILTENGWYKFQDLKYGIKVATLNPLNDVEYHIPDEYIIQDYVGEMIEFKNKRIDICVTPNHHMYLLNKSNKFISKSASDIKYGPSWRVPTGAKFSGSECEYRNFDQNLSRLRGDLRRVSMDDWLEFLGYYLSEGCSYERDRQKIVNGKEYDVTDYSVQIAQVKLNGRKKIAACLDRIGINYMDSDHHAFRICSKYLVNLLGPLGHSHDKYIPREYMGLSQRQSQIFLDALMLGDGTRKEKRKNRNTGCYYSMSKRLADDVQELALRCGHAATISRSKRGLYHVNIRKATFVKLSQPVSKIYRGKVYCINVKNHVICVRRNNKAYWCGNCYDEGKRVGESLAVAWADQYGTDVRIARLFNTYGPRMAFRDGRLIPNFILQAMQKEPLTIYGDGKQTRSFCFVSDTVSALIKYMGILSPSQDSKPWKEFPFQRVPVINIGNPDERTIKSVAHDVIHAFGGEGDILFHPLPKDDPKQRCPDITRAKKILGWEPLVSYPDGIAKTIAWCLEKGL